MLVSLGSAERDLKRGHRIIEWLWVEKDHNVHLVLTPSSLPSPKGGTSGGTAFILLVALSPAVLCR